MNVKQMYTDALKLQEIKSGQTFLIVKSYQAAYIVIYLSFAIINDSHLK